MVMVSDDLVIYYFGLVIHNNIVPFFIYPMLS